MTKVNEPFPDNVITIMLRITTQFTRGVLSNGDANQMSPFILGSAIPPEFRAFTPTRIRFTQLDLAGRAAAAAAAANAAAIPAAVNAVPAAGLAPDPTTVHKVMTAIYAVRMRAVTDAAVDNAMVARRAQYFAAVRLGVEHLWDIGAADYDPQQLEDAADHPTFRKGAPAARLNGVDVPAVPDMFTDGGSMDIAELNAALARFDESEAATHVDQRFGFLGAGWYATTGVNLARDGHNCTRTYYSAHDAVTKQLMGTLDEATKTITRVGLSDDEWRDLFVHKAMHVFSPGDRKAVARDPDTATRLVAMGLGAAAVRVPAITDEQAMLAAQEALVSAARVMLTTANVSYAVLLQAIKDDQAELEEDLGDARTPGEVFMAGRNARDRAAVRSADIAWVAGFSNAALEDASIDPKRSSQLMARSIRRVVRDNAMSAAQGAQHYKISATRLETQAARGTLVGVGLGGEAPPPPLSVRHWSADLAAAVTPFLMGGAGAGAGGIART